MIYIESGDIYETNLIPTTEEGAALLYYFQWEGKGIDSVRLVPIGILDLAVPKRECFTPPNLCVGTVEFMRKLFETCNLPKEKWTVPRNNDEPFEIKTLAEARKLKNVFIKPVEIKKFTGLVLDGCNYPHLDEIEQDTKVYVYEAFDQSMILSEWRGYVYNGELDDIRNYSGSPFAFPNIENLTQIVAKNSKDFPKTYTIDIAVMENGENKLIEYNDMWAIGNYGVRIDIYLKYLKARYQEIFS